MEYRTRPARLTDLPILVKWMCEDNWHRSLNMLRAMYLQDTEGFIVAETVDGQLVGELNPCMIIIQ